MNITDLFHRKQVFLSEANIINTNDPHDGHSIRAYLKQYTDAIKTPVAKKMFVKKIQKFLLNDPQYHYAITTLPQNAPAWAHEAMAKRDLYAFKPNPTLDTTIEHLTHYIAKMEEDMASSDANKKAVATKEFAGFPKAESLEMLEKKSNEYFARGAGSASSLEGSTVVMKTGPYTWLKLETADAYREAGNIIQNCIGSHWTKAKTENSNQSILVLANNRNDLIVAARIKNDDNTLEEMKGKNNKPPIDQYMPPVVAMINKFKLSISNSALNDLIAAGYYWDDEDKTLLSKPQAIKKLVSVKVITQLPNGLKLVEAKPSSDDASAQLIFAELYFKNAKSGYTHIDTLIRENKNVLVFEARRENGNPVISGKVKQKKLFDMNTFFNARLHEINHIQEAVNRSNEKEQIKMYLNELLRLDLISSMTAPVAKQLYWGYGLEYDSDNGNVIDKIEGMQKQLNKNDHTWKKYTEPSSVKTIVKSIASDENEDELQGLKRPVKKAFTATEEVATDRTRSEHDVHLALVVDANNVAFMANMHGSDSSDQHVGFTKDYNPARHNFFNRTGIDTKTARSIVSLAQDEKFKLSLSARMRLGVIGDDPEEYSTYKPTWKKMSGKPEAIIADFSDLPPDDRFIATYYTARTELGGVSENDQLMLNNGIKGSGRYSFSDYNDDSVNQPKYLKDHTASTAHESIGKVDAIVKINIGYGIDQQHTALALLSGKTIIRLDKLTVGRGWQGYDDYKKVAEILNKFADNHELKYSPKAINLYDSREFRIVKNKVDTLENIKKEELTKAGKREGADVLKFSDGWKFERMSPEAQAKWTRQDVKKGVRGQAWLLTDNNGHNRLILTVVNGKVARTFGDTKTISVGGYPQTVASGEPMNELPTAAHRRAVNLLPYIKTAMEKFNWSGASTGNMAPQLVRNSNIQMLRKLNSDPNKYHRYPGRIEPLKDLVNANFAVRDDKHQFKITQRGIDALNRYNEISNSDGINKKTGKRVTDHDLAIPVKPDRNFKTSASKKQKAKRTAGAGTKSAQALNKFKDHVEEHGKIPTRAEFIAYMTEPPFNMSKDGAGTYYYNTKKKYANLNEYVLGSLSQMLLIEPDAGYTSFGEMVFD